MGCVHVYLQKQFANPSQVVMLQFFGVVVVVFNILLGHRDYSRMYTQVKLGKVASVCLVHAHQNRRNTPKYRGIFWYSENALVVNTILMQPTTCAYVSMWRQEEEGKKKKKKGGGHDNVTRNKLGVEIWPQTKHRAKVFVGDEARDKVASLFILNDKSVIIQFMAMSANHAGIQYNAIQCLSQFLPPGNLLHIFLEASLSVCLSVCLSFCLSFRLSAGQPKSLNT